jgi:purine-binding chemotaxis protein CheW
MNQPLLDPTTLLNSIDTDQIQRTEKLLVFALGTLNLALPLERVEKILNATAIHSSGTTATGIVHLEGRSVTVLDLHRRLFSVSQPSLIQGRQFLILAKNSTKESFALLVNETPKLMDVPLAQIRILPDSYRQNDTLFCATHVAIVQQKEQSLTVFLLDSDRLLSPVASIR